MAVIRESKRCGSKELEASDGRGDVTTGRRSAAGPCVAGTPASSSSHLMSVAIVALQRKYTLSVVVVVVF